MKRSDVSGKFRRPAGILAAAIVGLTVQFVAIAPARADTPSPAAVAFLAPLCPGETTYDPRDAGTYGSVVDDLTYLVGPRLDAYNAGQVVSMYDNDGLNGAPDVGDDYYGAYPALCGLRYVAGIGPVAQWMFCTDRHALVCGATDADNHPSEDRLFPVNAMTPLGGPNPKLGPDENRIITYLIQNGLPYDDTATGFGPAYGEIVDYADTSTSARREALDYLVWCVSDPPDEGAVTAFAKSCAANMNADVQARILALVPDPPSLSLSAAQATAIKGQTARFTLTTNIYERSISIAAPGSAALTLCTGSVGTLTGTDLTFPIPASGTSQTASLCLSSPSTGTATLSAETLPISTENISWNRSEGNVDAEGNAVTCQVFADFNVTSSRLAITADVTFIAAATVSPTLTATTAISSPVVTLADGVGEDLANTGSKSVPTIGLALGLLTLGGLASFVARRRRLDPRHGGR